MKKTPSPFNSVRVSRIDRRGVFAKKRIPKGMEIIEYVGDKITKTKADRRQEKLDKKSKGRRAIYLFRLNRMYDIDGNVPCNTARFINHSCDPNCEAVNIDGHLWIVALRDIRKGEEITYNYGYDVLEGFEDHPCRCDSSKCAGYILDKRLWPKLRKALKKRRS